MLTYPLVSQMYCIICTCSFSLFEGHKAVKLFCKISMFPNYYTTCIIICVITNIINRSKCSPLFRTCLYVCMLYIQLDDRSYVLVVKVTFIA